MDSRKNQTAVKQPTEEPPAISGTDLVVRPGKDGDANRILALMREVFIDEMGWNRAFLADAARTLVEILTNKSGPGNLFLVCHSPRKIVAVVTLLDVGAGIGFIRWLVIHQDARGIGLGRLLLGRTLIFAKDAGFTRVRLVTVRDLPQALDFYLKAGFREVGTKTDSLWAMPLTLCFMEMEITL
ncbi:MAG: GNAT family N-acetyltransferase [Deltaproteobacteria bacterium]|nr:GNAT family N-acetyltransferase [Candidatus Zymogenaceae bacterium]